jgi:hypothetical protein
VQQKVFLKPLGVMLRSSLNSLRSWRAIAQAWGIFRAGVRAFGTHAAVLGAIPERRIRRTHGATLAQQIDMLKALGFNVELPLSFGDAVTRVREALKQEGFGVLTEIDLSAAFRE